MRLIVQFERLKEIRFISQLDLLRAIHRALRRADIPVAYSEGYNPQPKVSFGFALPVGLESHGEYMDITLKDSIDTDFFLSAMNDVLPVGMRLVSAAGTDDKSIKMGKMIDCAEFETTVFPCGNINLYDAAKAFFDRNNIPMERHSKKGITEIDVKPWIYSYCITQNEDNSIVIHTIQALSEEMSIRIEDLVRAFMTFAGCENARYDVVKLNTLKKTNDGFITPVEYVKAAGNIEK